MTCSQIIAPNGVAYAPASTCPGVLPRMLAEILDTRVMTKVRWDPTLLQHPGIDYLVHVDINAQFAPRAQ
jgi:hypothetical protein